MNHSPDLWLISSQTCGKYKVLHILANNKINTIESVGMKTYFYFARNINIRILEQLRTSIYLLTTTSTKEEMFEEKYGSKEANSMTT